MLTVKHVTPSGEEFIYSTSHVNFVPAKAVEACDTKGPLDTLWWHDQNTGNARPITEGTAYVMNDKGSTVSIYHLAYPGPIAQAA